jgi:four helix bundle protein
MEEQRPVKSYRDLIVWQRAMELCAAIYRATAAFPQAERFGLVSQMRRAAVSIPSNIAEGHGRLTTSEYRQFLGIARGSLKELETQIQIASDLGYLGNTAADACTALAEEVGRMLSTLIAALHSRPK